jgi:hypothetical protein
LIINQNKKTPQAKADFTEQRCFTNLYPARRAGKRKRPAIRPGAQVIPVLSVQ